MATDDKQLINELITLAGAVAERRKVTIARIGRLVADDNKFFTRLANGADCTTQTYFRVKRELQRLQADAPRQRSKRVA